jgi:hypothetical protein
MAFLVFQTNTTPENIGLEEDASIVINNILNNPDLQYFNIKRTGGNNATLTKVTLKPGPRSDGDPTEVVVIVAGPNEVGRVEVKK